MNLSAKSTAKGMVRVAVPNPWGGESFQDITPLEAEKLARELSEAVNRARATNRPKHKFGEH